MIISFAWTTPALVAGAKTVTRRSWTESHARRFRAGMLVDAYDRSPRTGNGRKVATVRALHLYTQNTRELTERDRDLEGICWLEQHGYRVPDPRFGSWDAWWNAWRAAAEDVWVFEFELVEVVR